MHNEVDPLTPAANSETNLRTEFEQEQRVLTGKPVAVIEDATSTLASEHQSTELMTERFEHLHAADGTHRVLTGIKTRKVRSCEDEPIHTPGAIQSFGVLITVAEVSKKTFEVQHVSECFTDILPDDQLEVFLDQLEYLNEANSSDQAINAARNILSIDAEANISPEVFLLEGYKEGQDEGLWSCSVAVHRSVANEDLIVLEFELRRDETNPLISTATEPSPSISPDIGIALPKAGMEGDGFGAFSEEDLLESTQSRSKPIRRIRRSILEGDDSGTMEMFAILSQINEQLSNVTDLQIFLKVVAGIIKDITKFHRVMLYQFDEQFNGQVVAELVDWSRTKDLFQGLFFPATDIPAQARAMYKLNKIRVLYDRDQQSARLVCRSEAARDTPLDMTHCFLRAMSPIHLKYLANMGISHNIERISYASRLTARKMVQAPTERNPSGFIVSRAEDLLGLFNADAGILSVGDEGKLLGNIEKSQVALALREFFRQKQNETITSSSNLQKDFPGLQYQFTTIAGVLFVPLSRSGEDFILFFRRGQLRKVHWAGNPYEKVLELNEGKGAVLLPRQSFKTWSEDVMGKCKEWNEDDIETAATLSLVYGRFIEVWREKQAVLQTSKLASILLTNAGHEVRTPLNAVINYLELALEGNLPTEVREHLVKSHTASKSLVYVINDLLDLTKTEQGQVLFKNDAFDLMSTVREAVSVYRSQADRRSVSFELVEDARMPRRVFGDQGKIRQVISNVTANALKFTTSGSVVVQTRVLNLDTEASTVEAAIEIRDTGCGMSEAQLDALFQQFELIDRASSSDESTVGSETETGAGLGLAIVARVVRNMNGQLRAESKVDVGSTFTFVFHFKVSEQDFRQSSTNDSSRAQTSTKKRSTIKGLFQESPENPGKQQPHSLGSQYNSDNASRKSSVISETSDVVVTSTGQRLWPNEERHAERKRRIVAARPGSQESIGDSFSSLRDQIEHHSSAGSNIDQLVKSMMSPAVRNKTTLELSRITASDECIGNSDSSDHGCRRSHNYDNSSATGSPDPEPGSPGCSRSPVGHRGTHGTNEMYSSVRTARHAHSVSDEVMQVLDEDHDEHRAQKADNRELNTHSTRYNSGLSVRGVKVASEDVNVPQRILPRRSISQKPTDVPSSPLAEKSRPVDVPPSLLAEKSKPLHVLVAEDDAINRTILKKRLTMDQHGVHLANDGADCYDEFAKNAAKYDVVLMDMQMPILDGMGAASKIRALESTYHAERRNRIPIIAVSASLSESQASEAIEAGLDGWIMKPVDFKRLRHLFRGLEDEVARCEDYYRPGRDYNWNAGGWLTVKLGREIESQSPEAPKKHNGTENTGS